MTKRKHSKAEEFVFIQINQIRQIKNQLSDLEKNIDKIPTLQEIKELEQKQVERNKKAKERKVEKMYEKYGSEPLFTTDDISTAFMRDWKEFKKKLESLKEQINRLQDKIKEKSFDEDSL